MASCSELSHEESGINLSDNDLLAREDNVTILVKYLQYRYYVLHGYETGCARSLVAEVTVYWAGLPM